jgi:DNA-binding transcriptional LysR family regulator
MQPVSDLDDLRSFVGIVDQGGLTAAVETLGIPKSTLSRKLAALEAQVGARLIDRSAHSFRLTEAGTTVYRYASRILSEVAQLAEAMQPGEPSGLLRITTSYGLAAETLGPILPEFLARFPKIDIDLDASSQLRDLKRDDFDVALRVGPLTGGALIARRLGPTRIGLFASPAYLTASGQTADSLESRPTIGLNRDGRRQYGPDGPKTSGKPHCRLRLNDPLLIKQHVVAGHGSGWLPIHMTQDDVLAGRLVHCRPDLSLDGGEVFVLFHGHKDLPAKTRVFVDFLVERLNLN